MHKSNIEYDNHFNRDIITIKKGDKVIKAPKILNNRYEIETVLSLAGATSVIYIATDKKLFRKKVLIKCAKYEPLLFDRKNNIKRESSIIKARKNIALEYGAYIHSNLRKINNIPRVIDYIEDINPNLYGPFTDNKTNEKFYIEDAKLVNQEKYIVLTYIDGQIITENILAKTNNPAIFTKIMIRKMGFILKDLHRTIEKDNAFFRFIYCDLKPDNILCTKSNDFILIDMGSVSFIKSDKKNGNETYSPIIKTAGFCASELDKVKRSNTKEILTPAVDIYSLGITAFILLTDDKNVKPNEKRSGIDLSKLDRYGKNWKSLISDMTEPDPKNRIDSIYKLFNRLKHLN